MTHATDLDPARLCLRHPELRPSPSKPGEHLLRRRGLRLDDDTRAILDRYTAPAPLSLALDLADEPRVRSLLERQLLVPVEVPLLVTGCGRSGTQYVAELLTASGADVGHESLGRHGIASWMWAVEAERVPFGAPRWQLAPRTVVHQLRHPLRAIASLQTFGAPSWAFVAEHCPDGAPREGEPLLLGCARHWLAWNRLVDGHAELRYHVEDIDRRYPELCARAGIAPSPDALARVRRDVNTRAGQFAPVTWDELARLDAALTDELREQARAWGYE